MTTLKDSLILVALCFVFGFLGFHLGSARAKAALYEGMTMSELEPVVNAIIDQHMAFVPALGEK